MTQAKGFISADDHVLEMPDTWTSRLSKAQWGDRIPHLAEGPGGAQHWMVDGRRLALPGVAASGATQPDRTQEPQRWEAVSKSAYVPRERLVAMDADGVSRSVLYPTVAGFAGETFGRIEDPALELACVQAYNDWIIEEWAGASDRFIPLCLVPLQTMDVAVKEVRRAVAKGHKGVILPAFPQHLRKLPHINDPAYDQLWATCQELGVPVSLHSGASTEMQYPADPTNSRVLAEATEAITRPLSSIGVVSNFLISGILTRFPRLKVVFAESTLGWGAFVIETADYHYGTFRLHLQGYDLKPSELFKRQCYLTSWYDGTSLEHTVRNFGANNVLWSTNFPQTTSTWPNSQQVIASCFANLAADKRRQILWQNAATLYGVNA